jgi:hypothetical protein
VTIVYALVVLKRNACRLLTNIKFLAQIHTDLRRNKTVILLGNSVRRYPQIRPYPWIGFVEELKAYADVEKLYTFIINEILKFRQRLEKGESHPTYLVEGI